MKFAARSLNSCAVLVSALFLLPALTFAQHYTQTNLVSDQSGAAQPPDSNLSNPWGLTRSETSFWWVADNNTGVSELFDGEGNKQGLQVTIPTPKGGTPPSAPSGTVFNGTSSFNVTAGNSALFIFVTEDGTISGWNPSVNLNNAILKVDNSKVGAGAVYKGCTIAQGGGQNILYVTNFRTAKIEVYNSSFQQVSLGPQAFADDQIPSGFSPFNIQKVGTVLVVTYAKQDAAKYDPEGGDGLGFVDIFTPAGKLLTRLENGPWFSAPWGIALTPQDFGVFSNTLLIGNFRGGQISAFDPFNGQFLGRVLNQDGKGLVIDGLWALAFGNGGLAGPSNTMFFTAGPNNETEGLFGTLTPVPAEQNGAEQ
jgi:uncharacterized protein (TIGR03118 family)